MKYLIGITLSLLSIQLGAQQLPVFSAWQQNLYTINPAIAGHDVYMDISVHGKKQWAGFENSPFNQMLTTHSSINELPIGVGGGVFNDQLGTIKQSGFMATGAYHFNLNETLKLGFGITGRMTFYGLNTDKLQLAQTNDPLINANIRSGITPDVSFGMLLHHDDFSFGLSAQNMLNTKAEFNSSYRVFNLAHYNATGLWHFYLSNTFILSPAVYVSYIKEYPVFVDFRTSLQYNDRFYFDLGFRSTGDIVIGAGIEILDNLKVHYNYDLVTSILRVGTSGSHEILMSYDFYYNPLYKKSKKRYKWIKKGK